MRPMRRGPCPARPHCPSTISARYLVCLVGPGLSPVRPGPARSVAGRHDGSCAWSSAQPICTKDRYRTPCAPKPTQPRAPPCTRGPACPCMGGGGKKGDFCSPRLANARGAKASMPWVSCRQGHTEKRTSCPQSPTTRSPTVWLPVGLGARTASQNLVALGPSGRSF